MAGEILESSAIELPFSTPDGWDAPLLTDCCRFVRDGDWIETKDQGGNDYRLLQISNIGLGRFVETGNYRSPPTDPACGYRAASRAASSHLRTARHRPDPRHARRQDRAEPTDQRDPGGHGASALQVVVRGLRSRLCQGRRP